MWAWLTSCLSDVLEMGVQGRAVCKLQVCGFYFWLNTQAGAHALCVHLCMTLHASLPLLCPTRYRQLPCTQGAYK